MGFKLMKSKSTIEKNANNNTIIQNSTINSPVILNNSSSGQMLEILAKTGNFNEIQKYIETTLHSAQTSHPLFPEFSASYDSKLKKLVSTPETDTAFKDHPKIIKGTYHIDYSQYPHMNPNETPWSYAYRTQTKVEMDTLSYQEYLGDMEDPFPVLTYSKGMKTIIGAPEFPEAMDAALISGDVTIPIMLRRLPCFEFGSIVFGNVSNNNGFYFTLKHNLSTNGIKFNLKKSYDCSLDAQLLREKLLLAMATQKKITITISGEIFYSGKLNDKSFENDIFKASPILHDYYAALIRIRAHTGCTINPTGECVAEDDYFTAMIMSASLNGSWATIKKSYERIEVDCSKISEEYLNEYNHDEIQSKGFVDTITLCQQKFKAETIDHIYKDVRISNLGEVRRAIRKKRKSVTVKIKPKDGCHSFTDYVRINGIGEPSL